MTPIMKTLIAQVSPELARKIEQGENLHRAIGIALTPEQQIAVSPLIHDGPERFIEWSTTDMGRAAIRELADKFVGK